jgi:hypothetical protein
VHEVLAGQAADVREDAPDEPAAGAVGGRREHDPVRGELDRLPQRLSSAMAPWVASTTTPEPVVWPSSENEPPTNSVLPTTDRAWTLPSVSGSPGRMLAAAGGGASPGASTASAKVNDATMR